MSSNYDVICFTESWLDDDVEDCDIGFFNHNIFRCDRSVLTSSREKGGGVLVAVSKKYPCEQIYLRNNSFEYVILKILINDKKLLLGNVYLPPYTTSEEYCDFINELQDIFSYTNTFDSLEDFILLGDFNLSGFHWKSSMGYSTAVGSNPSEHITSGATCFSNFCKIYKLLQFVDFKNSFNNVLDLVFSNIGDISINKSIDPLLPNGLFHEALVIEVPIIHYSQLSNDEFFFDFKRGDYASILAELSLINWNSLIDNTKNLKILI